MAFTYETIIMAFQYVEIHQRRLQRALKRFPGVLYLEFEDAWDHIARKFLKTFRLTRLQGPPGIRGGGASGKSGIFNRFKKKKLRANGNLENMGIEIYTMSKIAKLHETGGIVTGRSGRLAVPFSQGYRPKMYTPRGRLRGRFKDVTKVKGIFEMQFGGKTFLAKSNRRLRKTELLYVLKKKIRLRPRLGFMKTWDNGINDRMRIINKAVDKTLRVA